MAHEDIRIGMNQKPAAAELAAGFFRKSAASKGLVAEIHKAVENDVDNIVDNYRKSRIVAIFYRFA
ncbi:MAG TPA: hypothetical protein PLB96_06390 [Syntrophales bacterium]|mgnify:FL=1|nr:hypothetical protein [Syntrophales bacterium]HOI17815.1 hypothetical protein [Geobacteraceae bacterium]